MIARTTRTLAEIIAASLLGIMLLAGAAAWRLAQGPVPLNFLTQYFERALNSSGAPFRVTLERTNLAWAGWRRALDIRVVGVKAIGEDGKVIARVPEMSVGVSLGALLRGVIAPRNLDLIGPSVRLVRTKTGTFAMTLGGTDNDFSSDLLGQFVDALGASPDPARPITYLRRVSIIGAKLAIDDRLTGAVWGAPQADIVLLRGQGEIRGGFFVELDIGGSSTRISGAASWRPRSDVVRVEADLGDVRIDRVAAKLPRLHGAEALRLDVKGHVEFAISLSGTLRTAQFDLTAGEGQLTYSSLWPEGLPVKSARLQGRFDGDTESLDVDTFAADLGGTTVSGRASAIKVGDGIAVDGRVAVDRLALADIARYWPVSVGRLARTWIVKNMPDGTGEDGRATFSLRIGGLSGSDVSLVSLSGALRLRDTTIHYLKDMPPVRDVAATAVFSRDRFIAKVRDGRLSGLKVGAGTVRLTKLDTDDQQASIDLIIDGPLADALTLIDRPRFGFASRFGLQPSGVDGYATTHLVVALPMDRAVQLPDIRIEANSQLRNVRIPGLVYGRAVAADVLSLKVDKTRMEVTGKARVADIPATVSWVEQFGQGVHYTRHYEAKAELDDGQRQALGLGTLDPFVSGPVFVDLSILQPAIGPREVALTVALKDAALSLPALQWRKAPGQDGVAWFTMLVEGDGALRVREFDVHTPTLRARGGLAFDRNHQLTEMKVTQFAQGRTDIAGTMTAQPDGRYLVHVKGPTFDATPFLQTNAEKDEDQLPTLPPMVVQVNVDRVWLNEKASAENLSGEMVRDRSGWSRIGLSAAMGQGRPLSLSYVRDGPSRRLQVRSADAGALLRAMDVVDTVRGGTLLLSVERKDEAAITPWSGNLGITDFVLVKAPLMAQILTSASLTGIADMVAGKGIRFAKLDAPLSFRDGVVTIRNARTVGSELGITAEGDIDINKDHLALSGTIVPAYTLNSLLGHIPILGDILTGKKGSGIFAATYRVDGPIRKPTVRVNPLAALAPGFLRNLIGIFDGTTKVDKSQPEPGDTD